MDIDLEQLRDLMRAMTEFDVGELEIKKDGERVTLRRPSAASTVSYAAPPAALAQPSPASIPASGAPPAAADDAADDDDASITYITSPFVGTYYQSPSPDDPSFVKVGQSISEGTVLCIVEAMKLMNEIESEVTGEIVAILGENGKPVEYGDRLFKVRLA